MLPQNQPNQGNPVENAVNQGINDVLLSVPWFVAYFIVMANVDPAVCQGPAYQFGQFAKWAYLGTTIFLVFYIPMKRNMAKRRAAQIQPGGLEAFACLLNIGYFTFLLAMYVWSCVALANRDQCHDNSLVALLWVAVLVTPILTCCGCCMLCLLCCAALSIAAQQQPQTGEPGEGVYVQANQSDPNAMAIANLQQQLQQQAMQNQATLDQEAQYQKPQMY